MNIGYLLFEWSWCNQSGVQGAFHLIKGILDILRFAVPIGLIIMSTIDVFNKVINPDDKDGQKKLVNRLIAAVIVFLIPTFIKLVFRVIDWGSGVDGSYNNAESGLSQCWK